ncbi:ABC transporter substrate-binding protein [Thiorhodococcus mannitoliphagus]|uniref:ABC transporter substrate-binding protein n=1 Tax=Thiorhodococcus mannitoliphagus TaxID=329406 RepID=A0A6P1DPU5_9GAMM|nr:ABC transporter substrate-binding protein [Thiorhodococcus mannitoliphagus]NEX19173.1 ABC transporter substrate-binding protein [Thiorhodococcus mannitoliphagus]
MFSRRYFLAGLLVLAPLVWSSGVLAAQDEATALVKRTSERMLSTLQARRAEVDRNPSLIYGMVQSIVAPHFDFQRITQGAVGQYWRQATPAQQQRLVDGFQQVLIRTYARSLLSYSGEEIRYLPVRPGSRPSTVTVSTEVREPGSTPIPVDYRMYNSGGGWKVYDVVINNASLVGNYRSSFANEIRQGGVDGLIAKLADMNQQGQE